MRKGTGPAIAYACEQLEGTYWPIGLCIAWIMTPDASAAADLYARHRVGTELKSIDGWGEVQTRLLQALEVGQVEALGNRPEGGERVLIGRHEWIDLRIVQRGPYDEVRRLDGSIAYRDVRFEAAAIRKAWPPETPAMKTVREKRASERACLAALVDRMKIAPNDPVPKQQLKAQFPDVSERTFNNLFSQAARESGCAAWSKAGRRRRTDDSFSSV